ncbi:hypothetical protein MKJ04_18650 [Pontibacter sp. E15-1]|uniref:hypothetical protein n=1 Tax=Pontibacter sp. E15-1 TaxID=2919918 RepID=UPI001F5009EB|nr:hypothetical protein [Pontibacter sp. E15-1]MCJ8166871.1 hypothetical protein [Pontibacter sp. E15-1]
MNSNKLKTPLLTLGVAALTTFGLASCSTGTEPGDVNIERSDIKDEGSMIGDEDNEATRDSDTTDLEEKYYGDDRKNSGEAIGDGAYDGKGDGKQRDEVKQ